MHWQSLASCGVPELEAHARVQLELYERPPAKVGDWIAKFTKAFGIPPCSQCRQRQAALNAVDFSKPSSEVFKDLFTALIRPDELL